MVKNMIKWSLFCAATKREFKPNLDWAPYYAVVKKDLSLEDRMREYTKIAHQRFETDRFVEFCDKHLPHIDEVVWEFFGTPKAKEIVRAKVAALFPAHEVEQFTDHFYGLVQFWRKTEVDRMAVAKAQRDVRLGVPVAEVAPAPAVVAEIPVESAAEPLVLAEPAKKKAARAKKA
jgi:hypothetical protein